MAYRAMRQKTLRSIDDLELKLALWHLRRIANLGGVICEDCAEIPVEEFHPECWSSYTAYTTANEALKKIEQIYKGTYDEKEEW